VKTCDADQKQSEQRQEDDAQIGQSSHSSHSAAWVRVAQSEF
jgi:hypothetical protein